MKLSHTQQIAIIERDLMDCAADIRELEAFERGRQSNK